MWKALIKRQFSELVGGLLYDSKKGKKRSPFAFWKQDLKIFIIFYKFSCFFKKRYCKLQKNNVKYILDKYNIMIRIGDFS